jgi:hypothetical protein
MKLSQSERNKRKENYTPTAFDYFFPILIIFVFIFIVYFSFLPGDFRPVTVSNIGKYPLGHIFEARLNDPFSEG